MGGLFDDNEELCCCLLSSVMEAERRLQTAALGKSLHRPSERSPSLTCKRGIAMKFAYGI